MLDLGTGYAILPAAPAPPPSAPYGGVREREDDPDRPGRLDNGWLRLTPDVGRAFALAFGGYKGLVWWAVMEATWGVAWWTRAVPGGPPPDCEPVKLNLAELARQTGLHASGLSAAKRQLIRDGALVRHPDGSLEPDKRFDRWGPLAGSPPAADYCRAGAGAMSAARSDAARAAAPREKPRVVTAGTREKPRGAPETSREKPRDSDREPREKPRDMPREKPRDPSRFLSDRDFSLEREDNSRDTRPRDGDGARNPRPAQPTPTPPPSRLSVPPAAAPRPAPWPPSAPDADETGDLVLAAPVAAHRPSAALPLDGGPTRAEQVAAALPYIPGPITPDEAVMEKVDRAIDAHWPFADDVRRDVWRHRFVFPSDWFLRALKRFFAKGTRDVGWGLVRWQLKKWYDSGGPDRGAEDDLIDDPPFRFRPPSQRTAVAVAGASQGRGSAVPLPPPVTVTDEDRRYLASLKPPPRPTAADGRLVINGNTNGHGQRGRP